MRRELVYLGCALLVGGIVGSVAILDPGYMRLEFFGWVLESNLIVAVVALILLYFVVSVLVRLIVALAGSGASLTRFRERYRHGKALARARAGALQLAAGNWRQAADELAEAAPHSTEPVTIWLNAAAAARKAVDAECMQRAIAEARSLAGDVPEIGLMQARWQLEDGNAPQAVKILRELEEVSDQRLAARKQLLLARAFHDIEDWESLSGALKGLKKSKAVEASEYRSLEIAHARQALDVLERRFEATGALPVPKDVEGAWKQVPKHLRNEPALVRRKMEIEQLEH